MYKRCRLALLTLTVAASLLLAACRSGDTEISETSFRLVLPGKWTGGYDRASDTWIYLTPSQEEGVTVSLLRRPPHQPGALLRGDFAAFLQMRREQEQKVSDEPMTLSEPKLRKASGELAALYDGVGATSKRRTRTLVIVNEVFAAAMYYEAFGLSEQRFAERAAQVLERVGVASEAHDDTT